MKTQYKQLVIVYAMVAVLAVWHNLTHIEGKDYATRAPAQASSLFR